MMLSGQSIVVTGSQGFIGARLVPRLVAEGAEVVEWARRPEPNRPLQTTLVVDLNSRAEVRAALVGRRFDAAVHLAAVGRRLRDLPGVLADVAMTANLVEAVAEDTVGKLICVGSADQYGMAPSPQTEALPSHPANFYALSKTLGDDIVNFADKDRRVTTFRPFCVYGEGCAVTTFVGSLVDACVRGVEFHMSQGLQLRDFVHVDDVCDAFVSALAIPRTPSAYYNLGTGVGTQLYQLAQDVRRIAEVDIAIVRGAYARPNDPPALVADFARAAKELGWRPKTTLEAGVKRVLVHARRG